MEIIRSWLIASREATDARVRVLSVLDVETSTIAGLLMALNGGRAGN
jgi:hypothetical protein